MRPSTFPLGLRSILGQGIYKLTKAVSIERPAQPERARPSKRLSIGELLKPHLGALSLGLLGVIGEGVANLLAPWPLKVVLDDVLCSRTSRAGVMRGVITWWARTSWQC